jgi:hypothetical protein
MHTVPSNPIHWYYHLPRRDHHVFTRVGEAGVTIPSVKIAETRKRRQENTRPPKNAVHGIDRKVYCGNACSRCLVALILQNIRVTLLENKDQIFFLVLSGVWFLPLCLKITVPI